MQCDPPGYFGKLPARGDFLACRLPAGLAAAWDAWLGGFVQDVRAAAGTDWPEAWLTQPLWHFALGTGVLRPETLGNTPAAGVMIGSVDRVGRMFPFTIIGPSGGVPEPAWSDRIEALVLGTLEDGFEPATLDAALARLGPPLSPAPLAPGHSLWWTTGSDRVPPSRHLFEGLPQREAAVAMVLGDPQAETPETPEPPELPEPAATDREP